MDLKELQAQGGFVDDKPVKESVTWTRGDGEKISFDVHVVRQPFGVVDEVLKTTDGRSQSARMISNCIRLGKEGKDRLTYEQAFALDPTLAFSLIAAINRVNAKKSTPPTSSGVS